MTHLRDDNKGKELAVIQPTAESQEFEEDLILLAILSRRVFRTAAASDAQMPALEEGNTVEVQAADVVGLEELESAFADLDRAAEGQTAADFALAAWREEVPA